jgi:hypothetical protein
MSSDRFDQRSVPRQLSRRPALFVLATSAAVALALLLGLGCGSQAGTQTLSGGSFTTFYPVGWTEAVKRSPIGSAARYQLSSTGALPNGLGIPPPGTIAITIDETPVSALASLHLAGAAPDTAAARQSSAELLPNVVGTPRRAQDVTRTASPHATNLAGADAAKEAYAYTNAGLETVQVDLLVHHGSAVIVVELDTEPGLASKGEAAFETIVKHWRWR